MSFVIRRCVDFQEKHFLDEPGNEARKRFFFQVVREQLLDILIPFKHVPCAFVLRLIVLVLFQQGLHTAAPVVYINIETLLAECFRVDHFIQRNTIILIRESFLLQYIEVNQQQR